MIRYRVEIGLVVLALALAVSAVRRAAGDVLMNAPVPVPPLAPRAAAPANAAALERARATLVRRNPFRINRAPGLIRVGQPLPLTMQSTAPPPAMRPGLTIRAIVGGPPWSALVDGLPDAKGAVVVRKGDAFGTLTIGEITRDTLVAIVRDVPWKFGVNQEPQ